MFEQFSFVVLHELTRLFEPSTLGVKYCLLLL